MTELEYGTIRVELDPAVKKAIRELYVLYLWPLPSPELDCWTFDELAALYFRIEMHLDAPGVLPVIRAHLQDYLQDEVA